MAEEQQLAVTVWQDGSWKAWGLKDARFAEGDPNWLTTIPYTELFAAMKAVLPDVVARNAGYQESSK